MRTCRFCGERVSAQTYDDQAFIEDALDHLSRCEPDPETQPFVEEMLSRPEGPPPFFETWLAWAELGYRRHSKGGPFNLADLDRLAAKEG